MPEFDSPDLQLLKHLKWMTENLIERNPELFAAKERIWQQNFLLAIDNRIQQLEDDQTLEA